MNYSIPPIEEQKQQLNEALAVYSKQFGLLHPTMTFPVELTFDELLADKLLMVQCIRTGIPFHLFEKIKPITPFSEMDWAAILDLSTKSLQRYKSEDGFFFKPAHTEKILEMAELTTVGLEVFGSMEVFKNWLNTSCFALGKLKPMELLLDSFGSNLILDELIRIDHGIFV